MSDMYGYTMYCKSGILFCATSARFYKFGQGNNNLVIKLVPSG